MTSHCGKPIALDGRYERGGEAGDPGNPPACGRRPGHAGPCRSARAMARYQRADRERWRDRGSAARQARRAAA